MSAVVSQLITCEVDGDLLIVTLNRPDKLNAYTGQMGRRSHRPSSAPNLYPWWSAAMK